MVSLNFFKVQRENSVISLSEITKPITSLNKIGAWYFKGFWIDCDKWDEFTNINSGKFLIDDYGAITMVCSDVAIELFAITSLDWGVVRFAPGVGADPIFIASCVDGAYWVVAAASGDLSREVLGSFSEGISVASNSDIAFLGMQGPRS